jgi:Tfp pilus assembly protein PilP
MRRTLLSCSCALIVLLPAGLAHAQTPPASPPPAAAAKPAEGSPQAAPPVETPASWSYDAEGRRDPFQSLLGRGADPRESGTRPPGVAGLLISDVSVKGILRDRGGFVAMIQSPDNKTYIVRAGDRLFDGSVKTILQDKVVFSQDVNDPLSLVKQREIPKPVRTEGRGASPDL